MIDLIRRPIEKEFTLYQETYKAALESDNPILSQVVSYLNGSLGKELRPSILLLSSSLFGPVKPAAIQIAAALQILHAASLLHDDVVDETYQRRSKTSINAIWKNKVAILSGDYFLSKVIEIASQSSDVALIDEIAKLGTKLADGELTQLHETQNPSFSQASYFSIINKKTAQLFSFCAKAGAMTASASKQDIDRLALFGEYLGIIFQLKDDSFDYIMPKKKKLNASQQKELSVDKPGKPVANDLREGKVTLPLIYALENADECSLKRYKEILSKGNLTKADVQKMYQFAIKAGGLDYVAKIMDEYKQKALALLSEFPESEARTSLTLCVDYVLNRSV